MISQIKAISFFLKHTNVHICLNLNRYSIFAFQKSICSHTGEKKYGSFCIITTIYCLINPQHINESGLKRAQLEISVIKQVIFCNCLDAAPKQNMMGSQIFIYIYKMELMLVISICYLSPNHNMSLSTNCKKAYAVGSA